MWPRADTPEFQREVQEYLTVPYTARSSPAVLVPVVTTGGCLQHDACTNAWPPCPACTRGGVRTCSDTPVRYNPFGITSS